MIMLLMQKICAGNNELNDYSWFGKWLCVPQFGKLNDSIRPVRPSWYWKHPGKRLKCNMR